MSGIMQMVHFIKFNIQHKGTNVRRPHLLQSLYIESQ
jgi:hypothetical protein